jgi:hypothetical protein
MRALTIGVVLLAATGSFADEKDDKKDKDKDKTEWHKASPKGSKIEIQFPGKVKEEVGKSGSQFVLETMGGKAAYMLMTSPLPKKIDVTNKDDVKMILDGGRDGTVKGLKGKLLSDKDIKIGKYPGRAVDVDTTLGLYRARIYLTDSKMIQVIALGPKEFAEGADVKKFMDSLKVDE